jgi:hypothetical protein
MAAQYVPARTNHLLHWILCLFTLGLWFPVYCVVALYNHNRMVLRQLPESIQYQPPAMHPGYTPGYWPPLGQVHMNPPHPTRKEVQ